MNAFAQIEECIGADDPRDALFALYADRGTSSGADDPNRGFVAQMLASWLTGRNVLPAHMGLTPDDFAEMTATLYSAPALAPARPPIDDEYDELDDLRTFLSAHRAEASLSAKWIVDIVAAGCLGSDHLWSDLGLFSRAELSALMLHNFPELAGRNTMNMKWKKFIYRQHCESTGCYICRAPSCQQCADYDKCFVLPGQDSA